MDSKHSLKSNRKAEYEFSIGLRFTHWLRAVAIVILVGTGYYISYVFQSPSISSEPTLFMQAKYRMVHQIFGFIMIACVLFKTYLFFFDPKSANERRSIKDIFNVKLWIEQIKFYIFLGKHPHLQGVYNPLQFATYFFFYFVMFGLILTGLILYMHVYHEGLGGFLYNILRPIEVMLGGLADVRTYHRILMWVVLIFVPVHIYMAVFNSVKGKDGALDAIFSGYKFVRENH
ncbi:Ni/Fe hydrogenase, cytochrome b subunit [Campylobacter lari]|uniref:[NiFe] hydrogenase, cytochrome b subunit n=1 Tax=Campylobacter lari NCTC 11845 TaxID=1388749 RepID=A0A0A8HUU7_CAMLA|nr:Ni/Fe-hydrogenase, b-type cytochrome subunit [Campylobacter lari]AJD01669.1 [NiFe] hydrogenase, cytochrome b subunit [Campylobacter lari NCTC 11845]EAK0847372.1 Ni/Fe-hydrogenase, b-type cytochrome subunit [Campylobacter lari]EAK0980259.1 Ni/Fe-hydrogenase, b-type cytochrome subunit [Campylobacter lari]EAK9954439.1 Ni/Fe-hydrogenase, b-type cytochrome subunit [Campylobacter lari]MCR6542374.1 Ni/Fe-hydrogenase, b-type cytochrome subunit [Campylobacter lari]